MTNSNHQTTAWRGVRAAFTVTAVTSALALAACGSSSGTKAASAASEPQSSAASAAPAQTTAITFSLDYLTDGLHAPVYVASNKGWFSQNGLKVTIEPSHGSQDSITRVASGAAQMGFADAGTIVKAIATQHVPVKVVGLLLTTEPFSTISLKSEGITQPSQLKGKTIGAAPATSDYAFLPPFLQHAGMTTSEVSQVSMSPAEIVPSLLAKRVDAVDTYAQVFAKYASEVNIIPWSQYGIKPYGTAVIVNNTFLASHGAAVKAFLQDTYKGLSYTLANPASAAQIVAAASPGSTAAYFQAELKILNPYWTTKDSAGQYGEMTDAGWTATENLNVSTGLQKSTIPVSQIYTDKYL